MAIVRRILITMAWLLLIVYLGLVAYAYFPYPDGVPATKLATPDDRFIDVDGLQLRYRAWGDPGSSHPTIVLIHGFANSAMSFEMLGKALAPEYHVIALDMPGFGLSDKPTDRDYGNESQANTVNQFITALKLDNVVVGGHSMGGALAVHVAIDSPHVVGLILFNPGIITTGVPPAAEYMAFPLPRLAAKIFAQRDFRRNFLVSSYVNPAVVNKAKLDELMLTTQTNDYIEGVTALMSYYASGNEVGMLNEVRVPTLIIWGTEDARKLPGEAEQLKHMIAGSQLAKIAEAGHYVHEEKPDESAQAIRNADKFWAVRR